jgi:hypothetical protein
VTDIRLDVLDGPATSRIAGDLRAAYLAALAGTPFHEGDEQADAFAAELADEVEELHDALLETATQPRAWLVASPFDCPAVRLYRSRGWAELGAARSGWARPNGS